MRSFKGFVTDVARKPPVVMPYVALVHVLWLLWTIGQSVQMPFGIQWLQVIWMLVYTTAWVAACDLKKWGAIIYILLSITNTAIFLLAKDIYSRDMYTSNLFVIDGLFSFYLLLYFKKFS